MFTGLIEDLGKVNNINKFEGYWNIEIKTQLGSIIKLVTISTSEEKISLSYSFLN